MEFGGASFPPLMPRIRELYGASRSAFRVGEASAYSHDRDELEREERALERMVQELVNRQAPVPIGVKFHREGLEHMSKLAGTGDGTVHDTPASFDATLAPSSSSDEEEEMEEEDEEDETPGRATLGRGEAPRMDDDSLDHSMDSGYNSMETEDL